MTDPSTNSPTFRRVSTWWRALAILLLLVLLQRLSEVREGRQDSMQLWALGGDAKPRSLGVIQSKYKTLQIPVTNGALEGVTQLAISVENKDGVPDQAGPRLPYLFQGWLVQKSI